MFATALALALSPAPAPSASADAPATHAPADAPATDAPADAPATDAPARPRSSLDPPRYRGIAMFVFGGLFGAAGFPLKIIATTADLRLAGEIDRGEYDPSMCIESCSVGFAFNAISAPLLATSAGLISGGFSLHGRWAAYRDAQWGQPFDTRRNRSTMYVGAGLIAGGLGSFVASRFALRAAKTSVDTVVLRELGWWLAVGGVYSGAGLLGYGMGYRAGSREIARVQVQLTPSASRHGVGMGMSGRF